MWPERKLFLSSGAPPPQDASKPGPPRSQGARRTSQEECQQDPQAQPQHKQGQAQPRAEEATLESLTVGRSVQHSEAGRSQGLSGRPGLAAAPKEQARAGVAATLSHLITYTYSF